MAYILSCITKLENRNISNIAKSFPSKTEGMEYEHKNQGWHFYRQIYMCICKEYVKVLDIGKDIHFFREVILDERIPTKVYFYDSGDQIRRRILFNAKRETTILLLEEMNYRRKNESEIKHEKDTGTDRPNRFKRIIIPMEDSILNSYAMLDTYPSTSISDIASIDMIQRIISSMIESEKLNSKELQLLREICDNIPNCILAKQYDVSEKIIQQRKRRLQKKMAAWKKSYIDSHKE
ncbi:hypothetical protein HB943_16245 [Listeria weihenstephanensis]|uniref:Uncharacterized protein n=1 Tax=Listeria weihenstephanensis TaxID=1006155 RepID=A0A841ZD10_9LIST|nr:hypothetical protein [Listeria weihenstephanensis]MBC1502153.1 hypothetical protein [Listeria weihenstephanensis]